jgi:hypothetical protein
VLNLQLFKSPRAHQDRDVGRNLQYNIALKGISLVMHTQNVTFQWVIKRNLCNNKCTTTAVHKKKKNPFFSPLLKGSKEDLFPPILLLTSNQQHTKK